MGRGGQISKYSYMYIHVPYVYTCIYCTHMNSYQYLILLYNYCILSRFLFVNVGSCEVLCLAELATTCSCRVVRKDRGRNPSDGGSGTLQVKG